MKHERRRPRSHDSPPLSSVVVAGKDPGFLDSSGSIEVGGSVARVTNLSFVTPTTSEVGGRKSNQWFGKSNKLLMTRGTDKSSVQSVEVF